MEVIRNEELHPLDNPVVLRSIFQNMSIKDLKQCRQVSKLWRDSCKVHWRSTAIVRITPTNPRSWDTLGLPLSEFLTFVENEQNYFESPFTHFTLYEHSKEFWKRCGPTIKCLNLHRGVKFESIENFRDAIYNCCQNMKQFTIYGASIFGGNGLIHEDVTLSEALQFGENRNLKSLQLTYLGEGWKVSWLELFCHYPGLESISLGGTIPHCFHLFRSLHFLRQRDRSKLVLKHFDVYDIYNFTHSNALRNILLDPTLQLETFSICPSFILKVEGQIDLSMILSIHASTLRKIFFCGLNKIKEKELDPFKQNLMEKMEELELRCIGLYSLAILKFTPNIRKLALSSGCSEAIGRTDSKMMRNVSLEGCKELTIFWEVLAYEHLERMVDWLPNVEKLRMLLNNEMFCLMCERWTNMKTLEVTGIQLDDTGITGLDKRDVERINKEGEDGSWSPLTVPRPNLTSLKKLETFSVTGMEPFPRPEFGYCSIVCGIQQMESLKHLKLHYCHLRDDATIWDNVHGQYPWPKED